MTRRTWTLALAALLLTAGAAVVATSVQGQDYERTAVVSEVGAYEVEWESHEPGQLRLALSPDDGANSPEAVVSLVDGDGERIGTYTLTEEWPNLDHEVQPDETVTVLVHRAVEAEIQALHEEGHPVDWKERSLAERTVDLAEGDAEPVRTQVVVDLDRTPVHADLSLDGAVDGLEATAVNGEDETALEAYVDHADTEEGQALAPSVYPAALEADTLNVKLAAETLDGSLTLDLYTLEEQPAHVVEEESTSEDTEDADAEKEEETTSEDGADEEASTPTSVAQLPPDTPVAVTVGDADSSLTVLGEEGHVVAFGPDDTVVAAERLEHDGHEDDDYNDTSNATASIPVNETGEHVLVLRHADEPARLEAPADLFEESRELERVEVTGEIEGDGGFAFGSNGSAERTLDTGVFAFSWSAEGVDADREVRLEGPSGDTLYEANSSSVYGAEVTTACPEHAEPFAGPAGAFTVHTESTSADDQGLSFTFVTYER